MGGEPPKAPYGFVQYCASTVVRSNREWSSQVRNMEGCLGSPAKRLVYSSVHFLCVRVRSYQLGDRRTGTEEMERFCRPLPYHLATRTAETAGLPKPTRSIRPKPRVSAGIFVGTCHQAGARVQLTPGSPQARAPDPIVDLTAGPLEPGLEARVVPHLVVDPRGDEVGLPPTDETACPRVTDWSSAGPIAPQWSNHIVLQRAFFLSSILSWTGPPNLVNTRAISSSNLEGNSFRIGDRARVLSGRSRSASSRADVGEKPLAVLRHLPDRRGWRHSLVVTRTPHNHLDQHGREGEPLCRKPIDQPPRVSSIAPLPDDAFRLQALQAVRQNVGGNPFPPRHEILVRGAPLEH